MAKSPDQVQREKWKLSLNNNKLEIESKEFLTKGYNLDQPRSQSESKLDTTY